MTRNASYHPRYANTASVSRKINVLPVLTVLFPALLLALPAIAAGQTSADDEASRWYNVELIVFANNDPSAAGSETWPNNIRLGFPRPLRFLRPVTEQQLDEKQELPIRQNQQDAEPAILDPNNPLGQDLRLIGIEPAQAENEARRFKRLKSLEFTQLPPKRRLLNGEAARIERSSAHRLLFHSAWLQSINQADRASNLVLVGGTKYDQNYELSGSIFLYRERYLHLRLNLWFTQFTVNLGQEPGQWPILPQYPTPHSAPPSDQSEAGTDPANLDEISDSFDFSPLKPLSLDLDETANEGIKAADFNTQFSDFLNNQYIVERIVLLNQKRRMRSTELHYIDHPLVGILIQITPYEDTSSRGSNTTSG